MRMATISEPHPFYERLFMRVSFAWVVLLSTPSNLNIQSLSVPNGWARIVDLTFLTNPEWLTAGRAVLLVALGFYITRIFLWLALPVILLVNVSINAAANSQGAIRHAAQIVSLVLLVQTAACYYEWWLRWKGAPAKATLEERQISWSQQAIAATYFVAGLTKLITTDGAWVFQARYIGVQIFKAAYQAYYNNLKPEGLEEQLAIAQFAAAHGTVVALLCGLGLALELLAPLMLLGRRWGLLLGSTFLVFHFSIASLMQLSFIFHRLLVLIYIVSPIYWIGWASRAVGSLFGRRGEIPSPTSP